MNNELLKAVQQYTTSGMFSGISEACQIQLLKWYDGNIYNQTLPRVKKAFEILAALHTGKTYILQISGILFLKTSPINMNLTLKKLYSWILRMKNF